MANTVDAFVAQNGAGGNAVDSFIAKKRGGNAVGSFVSKKSSGNAVDSFLGQNRGKNAVDAFVAGSAGGSGSGGGISLSPLGTALDAQRAASQEAIFHGGSSDENRKRLREKLGVEKDYEDPKLFGVIPQPAIATHLERGLLDTALDTAVDPLTYETAGIGRVAKLGASGLDAAARALPGGTGQIARALQDYFRFGGEAVRRVGQHGVDTAIGALSKHGALAQIGEGQLNKRFDAIRKGLSDEEWSDALRLRNGEPVANAQPKATLAAGALKQFTDDLQRIRGGQAYREHYVPGIGEVDEARGDRAEHTFNLLDQPFDVHELERERFAVDPTRLEEHDAAFRGAIKSATQQKMRRDLRTELDAVPGLMTPEVRALFDRTIPATGKMRSGGQVLADGWRGLVGLPKIGVVGTSPRHVANIANLLAQRSLSALPEAGVNAARLLAQPSKRADILRHGIELGAISPAKAERSTPAIDLLSRLGITKPLAAAMHGMNAATWAFDDAAAQALAKKYAREGAEGYSAGRQARRDLVDYEHTSKATEKARNVMPFATFNMASPANVLRAMVQKSARTAALQRASGGTYTGGTYTDRNGRTWKLYNPTADIGRELGAPGTYARRTIADPLKFAGDFFTTKPGRGEHFLEYGQDTHDPLQAGKVLLNAAASMVPEAQQMLEHIGLGTFKPRDWLSELAQGATGVLAR